MGSDHDNTNSTAGLDVETDDDASSPPVMETAIPVDDLFDVLARPANRYVLTYLLQADGSVYAHELVDYILGQTEPPEGLSEREYRGQIDSRLLHASLPKLEDTGLVELDERRQRIDETDETAAALPYLRFALLQQSGDD